MNSPIDRRSRVPGAACVALLMVLLAIACGLLWVSDRYDASDLTAPRYVEPPMLEEKLEPPVLVPARPQAQKKDTDPTLRVPSVETDSATDGEGRDR